MKEKVAILMAAYNGEKYISEQIDSIIKQTYTNWVLFISDDGSTDRTMDIVSQYVEQYPDKIFVVPGEKENHGAKENFDFLLQNVKGYQYYMFSDQDDVWLENKINVLMKKMWQMEQKEGRNTPIMVFSDMKVVDSQLNIIADSFLKYSNLIWTNNILESYLLHNYTAGCSMLCNVSLINITGNIPACAAMHDYWIALIAASMGRIGFIKHAQVLYRQHENNSVGASRWSPLNFLNSIKKENIQKLQKEKQMYKDMSAFFQQMYGERMDVESQKVVNSYILFVEEKNIWKKVIWACKFQLYKTPNYFFMYMLNVQ